jgi:DNA invertase Pin-like site-specific DNA recombinase
MSKQRRLATSYSRFSDPKQAGGDSEDRQQRRFRQFCQAHNLTPLPGVYADRGRSGYKNEHRQKGEFGKLLKAASEGKFEPGTVIVAEAWDRFGRLRPDRQVALMAELLKTGVAVGICSLNDIFVESDFGTHKWTIFSTFAQLAYQESKQKSERVASSWASRRERARKDGTLAGSPLPAWLEKSGDEVRLIPERVAVVKKIFKMAADGMGHKRIVKALTAAKVPPFGEVIINKERSRSQFSGKWTLPYVSLILRDRRAVGEYQFWKASHEEGKPPVKDGPPIPNYYPAAVTEREFELARHGQEGRLLKKDTRGRQVVSRQVKYVNVFKSLLTHALDGEGFVLHNKGTVADPELILYTATGCGSRARGYTFPYHVFETAVLGLLEEVDPRKVLPKEKGAVSRADQLRAKLKNVRGDIAAIQADLRDGYSKHLAALLREKEAEEEKVGQELQDELARTVKPAEQAWRELPTLVDLVRKGGDAARLKLRPVLRQVVDSIQVMIVPHGDAQLAYLQVYFTGGKTREYLVGYWRGRIGRPAAWSAASWSDGWGTSHERYSLKDQRRAKRLAFVFGLARGQEPVPPEEWASWVNEDGEQYFGGTAELVEAMRVAATPEGGSPDPELIGRLVREVLGCQAGWLSGKTPAVE